MVNSVSENTLKTWLSLLRMIDLCCAWLTPFIPLLKHPFRFDPATFLNELIIQSKYCKDEEPYLSPSRRSHQLTHLISVDDWIGYCNKQSQELLLNTLKHSNTFWAPESRGKQLHIIPWKPRSSFLYISNCFGLFPIRISVHCQITMSRSFFNQTGLVPMILIEHSVPRPLCLCFSLGYQRSEPLSMVPERRTVMLKEMRCWGLNAQEWKLRKTQVLTYCRSDPGCEDVQTLRCFDMVISSVNSKATVYSKYWGASCLFCELMIETDRQTE